MLAPRARQLGTTKVGVSGADRREFEVFDSALTLEEVAAINALDTGDRCRLNPEMTDTKPFPIPAEEQYAGTSL